MKLLIIFVRSNGLRVWQLIIYLTYYLYQDDDTKFEF
jgi:L-ribulose-5-phosphate 3-epimerase UlaE